jgi:hypothetical protein
MASATRAIPMQATGAPGLDRQGEHQQDEAAGDEQLARTRHQRMPIAGDAQKGAGRDQRA